MDAVPIIDWLTHEGRLHANPAELTARFAERCLAAGLPVCRIRIALVVLHPQDMSYVVTWQRGMPIHEERIRAEVYPEVLAASPLQALAQGQSTVRHRLSGNQSLDWQILTDLRQQGHTDYFSQPLLTMDGKTTRAIIYGTDAPGGFTDEHIAAMQAILPVLSLVCEVHAQARRSEIVLATYLGKKTAPQVLDGRIARGDGETIDAVIWFCDLRGFTALSESLSRTALLGLLNDFFGAMTTAVEDQGGEVLKFIGDAILAIFTVEGDPASACKRAMAAVRTSHDAIDRINHQRVKKGEPAIEFGIALHVGDVHYGNIGGSTRLDFTVIGPAVNLASRIEGQTKLLGQTVLVSEAFYSAAPDGLELAAEVQLHGIARPQCMYRVMADD